MKTLFATTALACSVMAQNPPPSGGDPPFVPPAVNRAALNDLYKSTGGANWKNNDVSVLILLIYGQNCSTFTKQVSLTYISFIYLFFPFFFHHSHIFTLQQTIFQQQQLFF